MKKLTQASPRNAAGAQPTPSPAAPAATGALGLITVYAVWRRQLLK